MSGEVLAAWPYAHRGEVFKNPKSNGPGSRTKFFASTAALAALHLAAAADGVLTRCWSRSALRAHGLRGEQAAAS